MEIRAYQPGDEVEQVTVYNAAAAGLPGFKPANVEEHRRRIRAPGFKPESRWYAVEKWKILGYITSQDNGRISYPWTLPGYDSVRQPLFDTLLTNLLETGVSRVFTAYRGDWSPVHDFLQQQQFRHTRDIINFIQYLDDLPTTVNRRGLSITVLRKDDLPALEAMSPGLLKLSGDALEKYLFANPFFAAESLFVLRKSDGTPQAFGILILDSQYADVTKLDPLMPCFRLGEFGTEGMSTKRINGVFSFVTANQRDTVPLGLDLLWYATHQLDEFPLDSLAAQVSSDVPHLLNFYDKYFRRQGSFPIWERDV